MTRAYTPRNLNDPRIAKLRELLDQATKLLDGANELVADLTEQLQRSAKDDKNLEPAERRRKIR
jgi:ABC-type transporter Mla subunit MlaD